MTPKAQLTLDRIVRIVITVGLVLSVLGMPAVVPLAQAKAGVAQSVSAPESAAPKPEVTSVVEATPTVEPTPVAEPVTPESATVEEKSTPTESAATESSKLPVYMPPLTETAQLIDRAGGRLASTDKRVQLEVPAGLFKDSTRVSITPRAVERAKAPSGLLFQFDLQAQDKASDKAITAFEKPITLTVDLNGLIDRAKLQPFEHLAIFYKTDNPDAPWSELVDAREVAPGIVQVPLAHFSVYAAGSSDNAPAGWHLKYNPPVVSTFSGAATFNYPIEVPPGRNGLQPSIVLGYNSHSADGVVNVDSEDIDGVPFAWAMDMASISRDGTELDFCGDCTNDPTFLLLHPRFSLAINGANHDLIPATSGAYSGRYYAKDAPSLYVERHNKYSDPGTYSSIPNVSKEFWIVKTGDGTTYRFGYNLDSEQTQSMGPAHYLHCEDNGYCGEVGGGVTNPPGQGTAAVRWRVDLVTDTVGSQMTFTYHTNVTDKTFAGSGTLTAEHTRPDEIKYNYTNSVAASRIQFYNSQKTPDQQYTVNWFDRIYVYHAGETNRIREYQLGWDGELKRLLSIVQVNGAGTQLLPATTFTYTDLRKDWWDINHTPYLTRIDNGYGGATEFSYLDDGRYHYCGVPNCAPKTVLFGYSYRVIESRTYDGLNSEPARVQYAYGTACYDQFGGGVPAYCRGEDPKEYGPLVGHQVVTQTVLAYGSAPTARQVWTYHVDDYNSPLRGRELRSQTLDAANTLLTQTDTAYITQANGTTTFTAANLVDETTYAGSTSVTKRTRSDYDALGHVIKVREYAKSSDATPYRTATTDYVVNEGLWIVDTPLLVRTYAGDSAGGTELKRVGYYYDRDASGNIRAWGAAPLRGEMVFEDDYGFQPDVHTWTNNWYDAYGNVTATADAKGNTTRTSYDTTYNLYPVKIVNAKTQTTTLAYNLALGLLTQVTDPNNAVTQYQYDTFGRLIKVIRPGDSNDSPTTQYDYRMPYPWLVVPNNSFEQGGQNWTFFQSPTPASVTTVDKRSGNNSLQLQSPSISGGAFQDIGGLTPGVTYIIRAWVKADAGATAKFNLWFHDTAEGNTVIGPATTPAARWSPVTLAYTANATGRVRIHLYFTAGTGTIYVDDIQIGTYLEIGTYTKDSATGTLWSREVYDGLGRTIQAQSEKDNNQAVVIDTAYDSRNQVMTQTMPTEVTSVSTGLNYLAPDWTRPRTTTTYDALGRVRQITAPDGTQTTHSYLLDTTSGNGYTPTGLWLHAVVDANQHGKHYVTDAFNQLLVVRELAGTVAPRPLYAETKYTYDVLGNLTQVRDQAGNITSMSYNSFGQKLSMNDPDMGVWDYQYDTVGNMTVQDDAKHQRTCLYYDSLNRLTGKYYTADTTACATSNPPLVFTYTYDQGSNAIGRRNRMDDASGNTTWTYDQRGRVTQEYKTIDGVVYSTAYTYDALDHVKTITYPSGEVVNQTYNAAAQLSSVYGTNTYATGLQYNANGSLAFQQLGNGVSTYLGYFGLAGNPWDVRPGIGLGSYGRLWRARTTMATGKVLRDVRYSYDGVGNVTWTQEAPAALGGTWSFTLVEPFDTKNTSLWTYSAQQTVPYNDSGNNVVKNTGDGSTWNANFYRGTNNTYNLVTNNGAQVRFKVDNAGAQFVLGLESNDGTYRRLALYGHDGKLNVQYNDGSGYREPATLIPYLQANVWYVATFVVDDVRGLTVEVYPQSDATQRRTYNVGLAAGKQWRFHAWTLTNATGGSLYLDDYKEFSSGVTYTPDERMQFTYDDLDRLTNANKTTTEGYWANLTYNEIGNIQAKGYDYNTLGYAYNDPAHKHAATDMGTNHYTYDGNGNMLTRQEGGITYNQGWTVENRVQAITNTATGLVTQYVYDGDGNRVKKIELKGGVVTTTVYVGSLTEIVIPPLTIPVAPGNLSAATVSASQINLTWLDNSTNEDDFRIERSTDGMNWIEIATSGANTTSYPSGGLTCATTYWYRVRAHNGVGYSSYSNTANATTSACPLIPTAPSNLSATATSSSQINLTWTDNSSNESGFKIERSPDGVSWTQIATVGANVTTYQNTGLACGTTYYYRVRAYNGVGDSGYSNATYATTSACPTVPAAPSNLSVTNGNLTWTDNSNNETGFAIERSDGSQAYWFELAFVGANVTSYHDSPCFSLNGAELKVSPADEAKDVQSPIINAPPGSTTFYYRVLAYNGGGDSGYSNTASYTVVCSINLVKSTNASLRETVPTTDQPANTTAANAVSKAAASTAVAPSAAAPAVITTVPTGQIWRSYYFVGSQRVAMRETTSSSDTVYYFVADHLGSTSVTLDASANKIGEMKYYPFGETRTGYPSGSVPTDRRFTGQREESGLGSLYDYGARFYSPALGRFLSADTLVSDERYPQNLNRYAYVLNNPVKFTDSTGHFTDQELIDFGAYTLEEIEWMKQHDQKWYDFLSFLQYDDEAWFRGEKGVSYSGVFQLNKDRANLNLAFMSSGKAMSLKDFRNSAFGLDQQSVWRDGVLNGIKERQEVWKDGSRTCNIFAYGKQEYEKVSNNSLLRGTSETVISGIIGLVYAPAGIVAAALSVVNEAIIATPTIKPAGSAGDMIVTYTYPNATDKHRVFLRNMENSADINVLDQWSP